VWHLATTVNTELFSVELDAFAREVGASPTKQIVLVLDGAGWHESPKLRVPEHIHLLVLPPHSPELQPAEHLWPLTNEAGVRIVAVMNFYTESCPESTRPAELNRHLFGDS